MSFNFLEIDFFDSTWAELEDKIKNILSGNEQKYLVTPNPEILLLAQKDPNFKSILQQADIALPDGIGIVWASWFLSLPVKSKFKPLAILQIILQFIYTSSLVVFKPKIMFKQIKQRLSGSDASYDILRLAEIQEVKVGCLLRAGGLSSISETRQRMTRNYPNLNFKIWEISGYYLDQSLIKEINEFAPVIMLVGLGAPKQEKLMARHLRDWPSVKLAMGVGGTFDFITERKVRAPKSWQKRGLEWVWRFIIQPNRIVRIYKAVVVFSFMVFNVKLKDQNAK